MQGDYCCYDYTCVCIYHHLKSVRIYHHLVKINILYQLYLVKLFFWHSLCDLLVSVLLFVVWIDYCLIWRIMWHYSSLDLILRSQTRVDC